MDENMEIVNEEIIDIEEEESTGGISGGMLLGIGALLGLAACGLYGKVVKPAIKRRKAKKNLLGIGVSEVDEETDTEVVVDEAE